MEQAAEKSGSIKCHFWDASAGAGRNPNSRCTGDAEGYVRVKHSGRLCPLCGPCKKTFVSASKSMSDDVKKTIPGSGEFEEVTLEAGAAEFAAQPAKKSA
jgi:hypothetical protein